MRVKPAEAVCLFIFCFVIPAKAGIHVSWQSLDSCFRLPTGQTGRNDKPVEIFLLRQNMDFKNRQKHRDHDKTHHKPDAENHQRLEQRGRDLHDLVGFLFVE